MIFGLGLRKFKVIMELESNKVVKIFRNKRESWKECLLVKFGII